ncbi:phage/plasmid primase, P4 family [Lentilactobacillus raoultii]|uniref:Phage/plasmid primase, P4 family n=1 Tax=Lentilactobacillus raoultii TaxID=1987503 RepID=A0ABW3PRM7_9LACO|nr:DNA primase family protein [Lentilactobacillus raoultii]
MDSEIKALMGQRDKQLTKSQSAVQFLRNDVKQWQKQHQSEQQVKSNTLPPLTTLGGAQIMERHFKTCIFSGDENERLAVYLPREGIYTQNYRYIKRLIARMYAPFNERQADEIIYHMLNDAPIKEPTVDRYLVPVANGIWNLHKHELMPFSPDYVFTTKIATRYVDNPVPPNIDGWTVDGWLKELACGDDEIIKLLWEVINDSLNGNYTRKKAIFLYSEQGNSGKGTFQRLIENLVGHQNVGALKVNQFDERFKLGLLVGKTVCIGDDIPPDIYIKDSSNFNSVVTGDVVTIEFKGRDSFSIYLRCTIIQSCNGLPNFHNKGGTMRRIIIVPFNNHFDGSNDNWQIKDDYLTRSDVLEYVLYRALQLDFEKFDIPDASKEALNNFEIDNDPLIGFKKTFFDELNINKVPTYYLYEYYKKYCQNNGLKPLGKAKFVRRFMKLNPDYEKKKAKLSATEITEVQLMAKQDEIAVYTAPLPERGKAYNCLIKNRVDKKV